MSADYLTIERNHSPSASRKTSIFDVRSKSSGELLGEIRWFGRWRQYVFFPIHGTIWNPDCLRYVADTCGRLTREHREAKVAASSVAGSSADRKETE